VHTCAALSFVTQAMHASRCFAMCACRLHYGCFIPGVYVAASPMQTCGFCREGLRGQINSKLLWRILHRDRTWYTQAPQSWLTSLQTSKRNGSHVQTTRKTQRVHGRSAVGPWARGTELWGCVEMGRNLNPCLPINRAASLTSMSPLSCSKHRHSITAPTLH
jgi:hypothetical protein